MPGDLGMKKELMAALVLAAPRGCRLLKHTLIRVRWNAALVSTILWNSFKAMEMSWAMASLLPG